MLDQQVMEIAEFIVSSIIDWRMTDNGLDM